MTCGRKVVQLLGCLLAGAAAAGCSGSDGGPDAVRLESISVAPGNVMLAPGAVQPFSAAAHFSDGSTEVAAVTWSATGGTVTSTGDYTAGSTPGDYHVVATQQGGILADTALVTIPAPPPPNLVAVELTPPTATVQSGQTQSFTVTGRLSDHSTAAVPASWSATGGTISAGGVYTAGTTAGTYSVIATEIGGGALADTAVVTVTAVPATLVGILVSPDSVHLSSFGGRQFTAVGLLAGGGTTPVSVDWSATPSTFGGPQNAISTTGAYSAGYAVGRFFVIARQQGGVLADTVPVRVYNTTGQSVPLFAGDNLDFWTPEPGKVKLCTSNHFTDDPAGLGATATVTATQGTVTSPVAYVTRDSVQYPDGSGAVKVECQVVWTAPADLAGTVRVTIDVGAYLPGSGMAKMYTYESRTNPQGRADYTKNQSNWTGPDWTTAPISEFVDASLTNGANFWLKHTRVPGPP
jgi:hypothetical protein